MSTSASVFIKVHQCYTVQCMQKRFYTRETIMGVKDLSILAEILLPFNDLLRSLN